LKARSLRIYLTWSRGYLLLRVNIRPCENKKYLKGTTAIVDPYDIDFEDAEVEVDTAEWIWGKSVVSYP
jgi:hypothetical protein